MTQPLVFLQLNELNFDYIEHYANKGLLPNFGRLFERHGYCQTTSETEHHLANPWIQWPTVHTGLDYADHQVFRLGDIVKTKHRLIYETLEDHGLTVAAIGAFNAANNTKRSPFFIPDPWTKTRANGPASLMKINRALQQVTDDYASGKISFQSLVDLAIGALDNAQVKNWLAYAKESLRYVGGKTWYRAIVCDRLLGDAFLTQWRRARPDFATLFLNGGAHLQHHYLYSSSAYSGARQNPEWHVPAGCDPLLDILKTYDTFLADLLSLTEREGVRLMIASALHQNPHERETFYYRLDDQQSFLERIGLKFRRQYNLMTEDFVIAFDSAAEASAAERVLAAVTTQGRDDVFYLETADRADRTDRTSAQVFHIENRGADLYVQLKPTAKSVPAGMSVRSGSVVIKDFDKLVSMAQYKNTHHHGMGYLTDTSRAKSELPPSIPLRSLFELVLNAFNVPDPRARQTKSEAWGGNDRPPHPTQPETAPA